MQKMTPTQFPSNLTVVKKGVFCDPFRKKCFSFLSVCVCVCVCTYTFTQQECGMITIRDSLMAQMVKSLPAMGETRVRSLGQEDSLEKEMATHSSILAQKIP